MRRLLLLTLTLAVSTAAVSAHARAFRQTYGATVATADGGCSWNMSMDYFVPRTCDTCRYDLFSACKTSRTTSPACINQHPIYGGYCTPYAACRYRWRDHVYKEHCGCTPLACTYGPWKLERCHKHCCRRTPDVTSCCSQGCGSGRCSGGCAMTPLAGFVDETCAGGAVVGYGPNGHGSVGGFNEFRDVGYLPNVEPFGGVIIGTIAAFPARAGGGGMSGGMGSGMGMPMPMPGAMTMPGIPGVPQPATLPGTPAGGGFAYPGF